MGRPSKTKYYLDIAAAVAARSTCLRRQYGAIIVKNDMIISTGYNGSARGKPNCCDVGKCWREAHNIPHGQQYEKCLAGDTVIKLLNGEYKTIEELSEEGKSQYVYSVDEKTGAIVPSLAHDFRKTKIVDSFVRVHFDNGGYVDCTDDHRFMMRDLTYKEAGKLLPGDSVMPMNYVFRNAGHEHVHNTPSMRKDSRWSLRGTLATTNYVATHILVAKLIFGGIPKGYAVHHADFNPHNNCPDNLVLLPIGKHNGLHSVCRMKNGETTFGTVEACRRGGKTQKRKIDENAEYRKKKIAVGRENMMRNWNDPSWVAATAETRRRNGAAIAAKTNSDPKAIASRQKGNIAKGISALLYMMKMNNESVELAESSYSEMRSKYPVFGKGTIRIPKMRTIYKWYGNFDDALTAGKNYNHKVVNVEVIHKTIQMYDVTVDGNPNLAVKIGDGCCVIVHNCRAIHGEMNAIISASRLDMIGATLYLAGFENGQRMENPQPCEMCQRMIDNAGIETVISRE